MTSILLLPLRTFAALGISSLQDLKRAPPIPPLLAIWGSNLPAHPAQPAPPSRCPPPSFSSKSEPRVRKHNPKRILDPNLLPFSSRSRITIPGSFPSFSDQCVPMAPFSSVKLVPFADAVTPCHVCSHRAHLQVRNENHPPQWKHSPPLVGRHQALFAYLSSASLCSVPLAIADSTAIYQRRSPTRPRQTHHSCPRCRIPGKPSAPPFPPSAQTANSEQRIFADNTMR